MTQQTTPDTHPAPPEQAPCPCASGKKFYACCKRHPGRRFLVVLHFDDGLMVYAKEHALRNHLAVADIKEAHLGLTLFNEAALGRVLVDDEPRHVVLMARNYWLAKHARQYPAFVPLIALHYKLMERENEFKTTDDLIQAAPPLGLEYSFARNGEALIFAVLRIQRMRAMGQLVTAADLQEPLGYNLADATELLDLAMSKLDPQVFTPVEPESNLVDMHGRRLVREHTPAAALVMPPGMTREGTPGLAEEYAAADTLGIPILETSTMEEYQALQEKHGRHSRPTLGEFGLPGDPHAPLFSELSPEQQAEMKTFEDYWRANLAANPALVDAVRPDLVDAVRPDVVDALVDDQTPTEPTEPMAMAATVGTTPDWPAPAASVFEAHVEVFKDGALIAASAPVEPVGPVPEGAYWCDEVHGFVTDGDMKAALEQKFEWAAKYLDPTAPYRSKGPVTGSMSACFVVGENEEPA